MTAVVDRSDVAVLFWGRKRPGEHRALCGRYRERRAFLIAKTTVDRRSEQPRLGGRFVFLFEHDVDYERGTTGDQHAFASLIDVSTQKAVSDWDFYAMTSYGVRPGIALYRAKVLPDGTVGFSVGYVDAAPGSGLEHQHEIHRAKGRRQRDLLAAGTDVDPDSLRFRAGRMTWLEAGQQRSAPFG